MGMPIIRPGTITREEAVGNIIESVAMEEAALAHILNVESEKLLAVVNNPQATVEDLMAINKAVKNAITAITRLEAMLQGKLGMFDCIICE